MNAGVRRIIIIGVVALLALIAVAFYSAGLHGEVTDRDIPYSPSPTYETKSATLTPARIRSYRLHPVVRSRVLKRTSFVQGRVRRVAITYRAHQVIWVGYGSGPNAHRALVKRWQNVYWDFRYEGHFAHKPYATTGWWVNEALDSALIGWKHTDEQAPAIYHGVYGAEWCPYQPLYPGACVPWWHQDSASSFQLCIFRIGCISSATIWTSQRVTPKHPPLGYSENAWRS